jgi:hypothetical protein
MLNKVDLYFEIVHIQTGEKIKMDTLSICQEYSNLCFLPKDEKYNGIGRLPSYFGNDTADQYKVYVYLNGVKHLYDGLFASQNKESLLKPKIKKYGYFHGKRKH